MLVFLAGVDAAAYGEPPTDQVREIAEVVSRVDALGICHRWDDPVGKKATQAWLQATPGILLQEPRLARDDLKTCHVFLDPLSRH